MLNEEFVYAVIADHAADAEQFDKLLQKRDGKTVLEHAVYEVKHSKLGHGVDVVIVLSSNEEVLDAATDLGCVAHEIPGFFEPREMIRTYFSQGDVLIDEGDNPWLVLVDAETAMVGEPQSLRNFLKS